MRPLEGRIEAVREFESGSDPFWYFTKGYVDKEEFVSELELEYGEDYPAECIEHVHIRNVPVRDMPGVMTLHPSHPGRGAYKVTLLDVAKHFC